MAKKRIEQALEALTKDHIKPQKVWPPQAQLSTGSTMFNMAVAGIPRAAYWPGQYVFYVGDSGSGKTWLALGLFAEAARNPFYDGYQLIYDAIENGAGMDLAHYFGARAAARIIGPKAGAVRSDNLEDMYYNLSEAMSRGPCIYVVDSMDSLVATVDADKFESKRKAARGIKEDKTGSFGMAKAKLNSENLRLMIDKLEATGSILLIISQTRDNVEAGKFEPKKTRAGGHALEFYAHVEVWTSSGEELTREVRGKKRQIGITCKVRVKKNRVTGRKRTVSVPIYHSFGVDDTGSCVDYLVDEKHWTTSQSGQIDATEDFPTAPKAHREALVGWIEAQGLQEEVQDIVEEIWNQIEKRATVQRVKRYD